MASPRPKIVLYNPRGVFFTMPLALVAIGSSIDPRRYDVRVVDGRLERDPAGAVLGEIEDAVCLGVTVLTGAPIADALAVSRAAKAARAHLPVIWGGWHPSLFPEQTLREPAVDAVVIGQGEVTFAEIVERAANRERFDAVGGTAWRSAAGEVVLNPPRPMRDVNDFTSHDYDLIDVDRYFARKRHRQIDYISSQGCRFRCTFCADPHVYKRAWSGLTPDRMGDELARLWTRHRFVDVGFQDETFFTSPPRVVSIAEALLGRGLKFSWTATLRADQGFRLDDRALATCRAAGLRRVIVGVEAGSQRMLEWMKKDITVEQVENAAEKCRRAGIAMLFNFIVGFPDEPPESVGATLGMAKRLCAMSPDFQAAVFYFKPYPGNDMADALLGDGYRFPQTLDEWAAFDYVGSSGPWVRRDTRARVEGFKFYQRVASARSTPVRRPIQAVARWRCRRDFYRFPIEKAMIEWLRPSERLS
ncbi:MAG: radical SAM protein [Acidobacteria bacterium]|nr:radical SAM protein [Acidobacteriota bacterium]